MKPPFGFSYFVRRRRWLCLAAWQLRGILRLVFVAGEDRVAFTRRKRRQIELARVGWHVTIEAWEGDLRVESQRRVTPPLPWWLSAKCWRWWWAEMEAHGSKAV